MPRGPRSFARAAPRDLRAGDSVLDRRPRLPYVPRLVVLGVALALLWLLGRSPLAPITAIEARPPVDQTDVAPAAATEAQESRGWLLPEPGQQQGS